MLLTVSLLVSANVLAGWDADGLAAALDASSRPDSDRARDVGRHPAEIVAFMGVAEGDTVIDLMAGSGYYTEVFSVAVGANGQVYAQNPQWMLEFMKGVVDRAMTDRLADNRLPNVRRVDGDPAAGGIATGSVDAAFTALNLHDVYYDYGEEATLKMLAEVHSLLKPGGHLLVIDHNGPGSLDDTSLKQLHRMPEAEMRALLAKSDFTLVADSDLLRNSGDDMTKMVFAKGVRGATDRYVLLLEK